MRIYFLGIVLFTMIHSVFAETTAKITHSYIELNKIQSVSRFRSGIGHNYSFDSLESCRSMKHYFVPVGTTYKNMPKLFSPVDGRIVKIDPEWAGDKVEILTGIPNDQIRISIFHVVRASNIIIGTRLTSGQFLGTHVGPQTDSDIAVMDEQTGQLLSYFNLMTDDVFAEFSTYTKDPVTHQSMIITKTERDQDPLQCGLPPEEKILSPGHIENWVNMK